MPRLFTIGVLSDQTPEEFRNQFEKYLGIVLEPVLDDSHGFSPDFFSHLYEDERNKRFCVFYQIPHPFISDNSVPFEDYNYLIGIGSWGFDYSDEGIKVALDFALEIFNKLKTTERYRLMLVKGVTDKISEYYPS